MCGLLFEADVKNGNGPVGRAVKKCTGNALTYTAIKHAG